MAARKPPAPAPADLGSVLALLAYVAEPEMMAAAIPLVRARMKLNPEKLSILLERILNPDAFIKKGDEASVRGIHEETLKGYKEEKLLPEFIGALPIGAPAQMPQMPRKA